jgi:hypothetical protein
MGTFGICRFSIQLRDHNRIFLAHPVSGKKFGQLWTAISGRPDNSV